MRYTREQLADELSNRVRAKRLERLGMADEVARPHVEFERLPEEDQQNWLDMADVAIELLLTVPKLDETDHGDLPHDITGQAMKAAYEKLVEAGVGDPALLLIVEGDRPDGSGWGRVLGTTIKNPAEVLRLVLKQVEGDARGETIRV